jgi:glycine cleavage system H protein
MGESKLPKDGEFEDGKIWFSRRGNVLTLGLTSHGVEQLGDLEKIELPEDGDLVEEGDPIVTIEGNHDSLDVALDSKGVVIGVNPSASDLSLVTEDPLEEGWLVKFQVDDLEAVFGE